MIGVAVALLILRRADRAEAISMKYHQEGTLGEGSRPLLREMRRAVRGT